MVSPRWRKVFRDMWLHLPRTLLVILAIAISIFGVGFALTSKAILAREIDANVKLANQPSAILSLSNGDDGAVKLARNFHGISAAEGRRTIPGRVRVGPDEWRSIYLFAVDDFDDLRINRFLPESGRWPPGDRQILIERSAASVIGRKTGDSAVIRALNGTARKIPIVGTVYDPSLSTPWVDQIAYGYINVNTLRWLGGPSAFSELHIVVSDGRLSEPHIRAVANRLSTALERDGYVVNRIDVPVPGKHPATDRINSFLFLIEAFSLLSLVLSGALTATIIAALLSRQIRQVGVMKAIGAGTRQIMAIYFGTVLVLSLVALMIALPLSAAAGRGFSQTVFKLLNFNLTNDSIPGWVFLAQIALAILVPLLAAAYPVYRGSKVSVRESLSDYGVNQANFGNSHFDRLLGRIRGLSRPMMLSLRNTFRRRARMFLTLVMLTVGGASFIAAIGAGASLDRTVDDAFSHSRYDIDIHFDRPYKVDAVEKSLRAVPGVTGAEGWGYLMALPKYPGGADGSLFPLIAPPAATTLIEPPVTEGRWLRSDDTNAVVLNTRFTKLEQAPKYRVGDKMTLNLNGKDTTWRVVGIVKEIGKAPTAYADYKYFSEITREPGLAASARVTVKGHERSLEKSVSRALERKLAKDGFYVSSLQPVSFSRQVQYNHIVIQLVFLMLMSILVAAVGALGLASTMSVNVSERVREIGVMRSIGASTGAILRIVVAEGFVIAILSWFLAIAVAIPLTKIIADIAGNMLLKMPLNIVIPMWAPLLWLAIVVIVSTAASVYPALNAARLTVREVLAYE